MMTVRCLLTLFICLHALIDPPFALAGGVVAGALQITEARVFETPPRATSAGGYLTITNAGPLADKLVAVKAEGLTAIIHRSSTNADGVTSMEMLMDGLEIPPGATVALEPGALHIMFTGLQTGTKAGEVLSATLVFEVAGPVAVNFAVTDRNPSP